MNSRIFKATDVACKLATLSVARVTVPSLTTERRRAAAARTPTGREGAPPATRAVYRCPHTCFTGRSLRLCRGQCFAEPSCWGPQAEDKILTRDNRGTHFVQFAGLCTLLLPTCAALLPLHASWHCQRPSSRLRRTGWGSGSLRPEAARPPRLPRASDCLLRIEETLLQPSAALPRRRSGPCCISLSAPVFDSQEARAAAPAATGPAASRPA